MNPQTFQQLAICSWSGWPETPEILLSRLAAIGLNRIQLALDPLVNNKLWNGTPALLRDAGVTVVSGMFATSYENYDTPETIRLTGGLATDDAYNQIVEKIPQYVALMDEMRIDKVSFHAGFISHDKTDPHRETMLRQLTQLADILGEAGKTLLLETGQETATTLVETLKSLNLKNLKVNFDPGNMLLYNMGDPIEALRILLPYISQIHIKDAIPSGNPDIWGTEKTAGEGNVDWAQFFTILAGNNYTENLVIEREVGNDPIGEIRRAVSFLSNFLLNNN